MSLSWIVLDEIPFAQIASALDALAWARLPEPSASEPLSDDEPESAQWESRDIARGRGRLRYIFFPSTRLRALQLDAPAMDIAAFRTQIERYLPTLNQDAISKLLQSDDLLAILRGIQAAEVLLDPAWIESLNRLLDHPHPVVAREARAALVKTLSKSAQQGAALIEAIKPGATAEVFNAALFTGMPSARQRRQALRWLMQQQTQSNRQIDAVLAAALRDADWEVRVTAMLAAGRLRATAVRGAVATVALPASLREGVDSQDQRVLVAMRAAVLAMLDGHSFQEARSAEPARERIHRHIARCVAGEPVEVHDRIFLYCHSLTTPFAVPFAVADSAANQPSSLPPGVSRTLDGYQWQDIDLIWIPAVTAWLGDEAPHPQVENPIRQAMSAGFFVARKPLADDYGAVNWFDLPASQRICEELSTRTGARVRLPSADEWEIAARGTDGRRFPWGNGLPPPQDEAASPWGMEDAVGHYAQWCIGSNDVPLLVGDIDQWRCSMRKLPPNHDAQATVRIVIEL